MVERIEASLQPHIRVKTKPYRPPFFSPTQPRWDIIEFLTFENLSRASIVPNCDVMTAAAADRRVSETSTRDSRVR